MKQLPYVVIHPDGEPPAPEFATWKEALTAQKMWNQDVTGHRARKLANIFLPTRRNRVEM